MSSEEAKAFVIDTVLKPAIESQLVSQRVRDITKSQIPWVSNFKKVGDVYRYLLSTTRTKDDNVDALQIVGLRTYEDIIPEFKQRFSSKLTDVSDFSDFSVDQEYSWREVLSVVGQYDTRSGGIQLYKVNEELDSIAIKVTLNGGKYLNEWLVPDKLLKYYMKSIKGEFKETYVDNSAIINSPNVSIHVFVRQNSQQKKFVYKGEFRYIKHFDDSGAKWFQLEKYGESLFYSHQEHETYFEKSVLDSLASSSKKRRKRLKKASKKPKVRIVTTLVYDRNPDVVAEVLLRANGVCEGCGGNAPFRKRSNDEPYLEVHHEKPLAENGDDTIENAIALCPNCHRERHFG
ncbi:HNH endonuclease [Vibrio parahaemolyticus]|uniref:HNH endonuclease n=1 Tax=Vibrio parahaemolyticus TaxID=670 RepID=UPI00046FBB70|nr:HNH endonuclease signature motif containing protein [Vibrio parahaemolyticus]EGR2759316.1 HNH endonuclease [Vibrio parahaemolyticus]EHK0753108.1 HNH endonuclease [Vibrio parahaemolyticus]EJE4178461.1 HNH endonuclease [Vibrio parahaemolyticus]MBE3936070.1 HNH endonuclease [Vibrio parahaemolyticus]MCR9782133.1 HNH endonuclease [Vibrio parahaemolyticus]